MRSLVNQVMFLSLISILIWGVLAYKYWNKSDGSKWAIGITGFIFVPSAIIGIMWSSMVKNSLETFKR